MHSRTSFLPSLSIAGLFAFFASPVIIAADFEHTAYLKAHNAAPFAYFGSSVAIDGDIAVVGAPFENSDAAGVDGAIGALQVADSGAAYVYQRVGLEWNQIAHIKASTPVEDTKFGHSVSISGNLIAIGQPSSADGGRVHVYRVENEHVLHETTLAASNAENGDSFGFSISISGQSLVVGAPDEDSASAGINGNPADNSKSSAGAAYVFFNDGASWTQQAYIKASNPDSNDQFGASVGISENTVVVGAPLEDSNATGINGWQDDNSSTSAGAAYVFVRNDNTWSQQAYLKASNTGSSDKFGYSVALDKDQLLVGAIGEASAATGVHGDQLDNSRSNTGAVYAFSRSSAAWTQRAYIKQASYPSSGPIFITGKYFFGRTLSIDDGIAVIGADGISLPNPAGYIDYFPGAAYVFYDNGASWVFQKTVEKPARAWGNGFGTDVGLSGGTLIIGNPSDRSGSNTINGTMIDENFDSVGAAFILTPPLLEVSTVRNIPATLAPIPPNGLASKHFQLLWQPILGNRYDVKRSNDLVDWTSFPGFPAATIGTHEIIGVGPREFYKVVDIDATPPDGILSMYPAAGSFAVPRFADILIELNNAAKVIPGSLKLTLGDAGPFTLENSPRMTFNEGRLLYDVVDTALGAAGDEVHAVLVVSDEDGFTTTYRWKFDLEKPAILVEDLFVFGSANAQRSGQRFSVAQRAVAAATVGNVRLPANGGDIWSLSGVTDDSLVISYTGAAPAQFHAGQYLANDAPSNQSQIFYRRVTAVSVNAPAKTLTLSTIDVLLTDIVEQGSSSFSDRSLFFDPDAIGDLVPMGSLQRTFEIGAYAENFSGTSVGAVGGISLSFEELGYLVTPTLSMSFDISLWGLDRFEAIASARLDVAAVPRADFYAEVATIGQAELVAPRTVKVIRLGAIGFLPIWVSVDFSMQARWGGNLALSGYIRAGFRKTWEVRTSVLYDTKLMRRPIYTAPELITAPTVFVGPEVTTEANASAWIEVEPRFDFRLQSLVGGYLSVNPRVTNSATIERTNGEITRKGFTGSAAANLGFGFSVLGISEGAGWPKGDRTLFNIPWCMHWHPDFGWRDCNFQDGSSDTSR